MDELKQKLDQLIKANDVNKEGIEFLIDYYIRSLGWSYEKAVEYTIELFENDTIDEVKVIGGKGNGKTD